MGGGGCAEKGEREGRKEGKDGLGEITEGEAASGGGCAEAVITPVDG